jgi:PadR family transcriptional regulator, regulatory protein AphA
MSSSRSGYCVLGCLSSGPKSGYDIRMMMNEVTSFFWKESDGQLYPALKSLMQNGYISQLETTTERNKKVYEITEQGRALLREWLVEPAGSAQVRSEFLLKVFLGNELDKDKLVTHLERERQQLKEKVSRLSGLVKTLAENNGNPRVIECWDMTIELGLEVAETELRWCERHIHKLQCADSHCGHTSHGRNGSYE